MWIPTVIRTIVRIAGAVAAIGWWRTREKLSLLSKPRVTEDELLRFFGDRANFAERPIAAIELALGPWNQFDDWDLGRVMYDWESGGVRVRVRTSNGVVVCVDYYKRGRGARFEIPDRTIWQISERGGSGSDEAPHGV